MPRINALQLSSTGNHLIFETEPKNSNREGGNKGARQKFPFLPTFSSSTTLDTTMKLKKTSKVKLFDYIEYYIHTIYVHARAKSPKQKLAPWAKVNTPTTILLILCRQTQPLLRTLATAGWFNGYSQPMIPKGMSNKIPQKVLLEAYENIVLTNKSPQPISHSFLMETFE